MAASPLPAEMLAHRYDPGHDAVQFLPVPRALRRSAPFLTDDDLKVVDAPLAIRRGEAVAAAAGTARLNFIFHSAYCCSTLLANAYDRPGAAFSLKEPVLLNDLVGWRHRGATPAQVGAVLGDGLALMARPWAAGEVGVVKPSNVVNALIPAIVGGRGDAGVLLLHAPLNVYLGSIASKGLWGRRWVRDLLMKQLTDGIVDLGFEPNDYFLQTDLQVAAVGWLAQHRLFAEVAARWPGRVRTLDSEILLAAPAAALARLDALFGVTGSDADRAAVVGDVFGRNAKSGVAFTAADRTAGQQNAATLHGEEIEKVIVWAEAVAANVGLAMALPRPLLE